jgi:hypothetical protein
MLNKQYPVTTLPVVDRTNQIKTSHQDGATVDSFLRDGAAPCEPTLETLITALAALPVCRQEEVFRWLLQELKGFAVDMGAGKLPVCLMAPQHLEYILRLLGALRRSEEAVKLTLELICETSFDMDALFSIMRYEALVPFFAALRADEGRAWHLFQVLSTLPQPEGEAPAGSSARAVGEFQRLLYEHIDYVNQNTDMASTPVR